MKKNDFLITLPFLTFILVGLIIVGCGRLEINNSSEGYPITINEIEEDIDFEPSYPINDDQPIFEDSILIIPTPTADKGLLYGQIISLSINEPIPYSRIYLGSKVDLEQDEEYFITIHQSSSPNGTSNQNGKFMISEISPGNYILIFSTPDNNYPLLDKNNEQIHLTIKGGESIDLGEVFTTWP